MTTGDKGKLFILFVPLFTLSLLSKIVCSLWPSEEFFFEKMFEEIQISEVLQEGNYDNHILSAF